MHASAFKSQSVGRVKWKRMPVGRCRYSLHLGSVLNPISKMLTKLFLIALTTFSLICNIKGQLNNTATWCTISKAEYNKCMALSRAVDREIYAFGSDYVSLTCKFATNKDECMTLLDFEKAHLTTLDSGEVFVGGRYHSLVPIMQEIYDSGLNYQYAVAVVKKGSLSNVNSLYDLRGKKACFAGVGTLAGWITPIFNLMRNGGMKVVDCNNHVKSAIQYFGPSCAVNSLSDKYNPLGDNSHRLCELCTGDVAGVKCTSGDPYAGYEGAFKCLVERGEVAFLTHTTVEQMTSISYEFESLKKEQFELLCRDGTRRNVDEYRNCNWGNVPAHAIVTSSATNQSTRKLYQRFLEKAARILSKKQNMPGNVTDYYNNNNNRFNNRQQGNSYERRTDNNNRFGLNEERDSRYYNDRNDSIYGNPWDNRYNQNYSNGENAPIDSIHSIETFDIFESAPRYGIQRNLLFSDITKDFVQIREKDQTYVSYLGKGLDAIMAVRQCSVKRMKLCVTSDVELEKCIKMKIALKAQLLKPDLECFKGYSHRHCMQYIQEGHADVTLLDAADIYAAGLHYDLIPFISESYNLDTPHYYVVAVAKEEDDNTDLTYLKNKNTCHTGASTAAGWVYPMAYLISNAWIRGYGCDSMRAASEYFTKSCVPGALNAEYNIEIPHENLCGLCHGTSSHYCQRDASEDYYGYTGAFRCLVEGGGDVAFVKHTTVSENTDGKRREFWARNTFTKDFQLLCPDGTRKQTPDYAKCNLGRVSANAVVTRGGEHYNETEINAYINLFIYAQQFYGKKDNDEFSFSLFYSVPPYSDLIFQDATQQLMIIPKEKRNYRSYLGEDFLLAKRITDCTAGTLSLVYQGSWMYTLTLALVAMHIA